MHLSLDSSRYEDGTTLTHLNAAGTRDHISQVIFDYAARITQEQDTATLLRLNADMARDLVSADRCSIWLIDGTTNQLYTTVAHGVGELRIDVGHGLVGACIARGEPIVVNDTSVDTRFLNRIDESSGYVTKSVLVMPLRTADGKIIGAFQALNKAGGFTASDVTLLGLAGSFSASAIETQRLRKEAEAARLLRRELEIARDVQTSLLPRTLPAIAGIECAAFFRPAKAVGGDYYDFVRTPTGSFGVTVGDVSGKGVPAAVLMASIQSALRLLLRGEKSLPELVSDLNNSVNASTTDHYSTLFCGVIDPQSLSLGYVNAGHCPPMLMRRETDGIKISRLKIGGTPVGMVPDFGYEQGTIDLHSGDVLVCFSDGISEAVNVKEELWNETDIKILLRQVADRSANEIAESLVAGADTFAGDAGQVDDMTVLTLRIR